MQPDMTDGTKTMDEAWFHAEQGPSTIRSGFMPPDRLPRPGERALGAFILPPFQRPETWSTGQKVAFIESIWDGLPLQSYTLNSPRKFSDEVSDWLLDGQQRWTAIHGYVASKFPVRGVYWSELTLSTKRGFMSRQFQRNESKIETEAGCYEVYKTLAYGGTMHLPDDVSLEEWQEIAGYVRAGVEASGRGAELEHAIRFLETRMGLRGIMDELAPAASPSGPGR